MTDVKPKIMKLESLKEFQILNSDELNSLIGGSNDNKDDRKQKRQERKEQRRAKRMQRKGRVASAMHSDTVKNDVFRG